MTSLMTRELWEKEEAERLAPFAVKSMESAGRVHPEPPHPYRTAFQRDRDRVLHSAAFRRLEYKTQVFVHHEDDHYRNRLTHTLEGAQIARTAARVLRLNEDLAEAVALSHDLGHTPFGHAGERVLNELMEADGGFDHNRQSLRVVDLLEERYAGVPGLNLTAETREGILKNGGSWPHALPLPPLGLHRNLEAQVADAADEIAYTHHDLDDGLRSGILDDRALAEVSLWQQARTVAESRLADAGPVSSGVWRSQTLIALVNGLVTDLVEATAAAIDGAGVRSVDDVRAAPTPLVRHSKPVAREKLALKRFLFERFYEHPRVRDRTLEAARVISELFGRYREDPGLLPEWARVRAAADDDEARAVADYVAGMTDRFAMAEHRRLLGPHAAG